MKLTTFSDDARLLAENVTDFAAALDQGMFQWSTVVDLADVLTGKVTPRQSDDAIVIFKSVGMAIEDLALAAKLLELAKQQKVGRQLP